MNIQELGGLLSNVSEIDGHTIMCDWEEHRDFSKVVVDIVNIMSAEVIKAFDNMYENNIEEATVDCLSDSKD